MKFQTIMTSTIISLSEDQILLTHLIPTFPEGVKEGFNALTEKLPQADQRLCYGIFQHGPKGIHYQAAYTVLDSDEEEQYECTTFTLEKGDYLCVSLYEWYKKIPSIGASFTELFKDPRVDPKSPSIEFYKTGKDLVCMVKVKE